MASKAEAAAYARKWRATHPDKVVAYNKAYRESGESAKRQARRYLKFRAFLIAEKSKPCMDCRGIFPPCVMDFDHVRGTKLFCIGFGMHRPPQVLAAEIAKCDLVCSNCHRIRTEKRRTRQ